ncbi:MAG: hypothetical protein AB7F75_04535 [Planctomycetota bacterium]
MSFKITLINLALVSAASVGTYSMVMKDMEEQTSQSVATLQRTEAALKDNAREIERLRNEMTTLRLTQSTPALAPAATQSATPSVAPSAAPSTVPNKEPSHAESDRPQEMTGGWEEKKVQQLVETALTEREKVERAENLARWEKRREENQAKMLATLGEKLNLSTSQTEEIKEILDNAQKQTNAVREEMRAQWEAGPSGQTQTSREEIRKKFTAIHDETHANIEHVIGSTNMEAYKKISDEFSDRGFMNGQRGRWMQPGQETPPAPNR